MLRGQVALVTGAANGMGREIAKTLSQQGAEVLINDISEAGASETVSIIEKLGGKARAAVADITKMDHVEGMVQKAIQDLGRIDILVNNAGIWTTKAFAATTPTDWEADLHINLYGVLHCTRAVLPHMIQQQRGNVVTIVSDAGRIGEPNLAVYSAAKAGAIGFSKALAKEVGRHQIRVNCVAMATTRTRQTDYMLADGREEKVVKLYPLGRIGETQDAANAVLFLVSNQASWITGQVIPVNGGYTMIG